MSGALLVAGTSSDAGKSMVVAGLCRLLARKGVSVAPFKAQNMSNNSAVTVEGGEIGRAQDMQARGAGLAPSVRFNPVLLKPGGDRTSQLVVRGQVAGSVKAGDYMNHRDELAAVVADELASLRTEFDAVICEGAGSPAEINLRATDLANMGLARDAHMPVVLVGDIDRGGLLAHLFGTLAVLEPEDQKLIAGFVVNKFRGDPTLLEPGLRQLEQLTGRPTYGVLPYVDDLWLDTEDTLSVLAGRVVGHPEPPRGADWLRVAAIRLPRTSNSTDVEALACEPGVLVRWTVEPTDVDDADVVVIPEPRPPPPIWPGFVIAGWPTPSRGTRTPASRSSASAAAFRCSAAASTTGSNRQAASSMGSTCWMPTSSSARRRRFGAAPGRSQGMRFITGRSADAPKRSGRTSASAAARCMGRTGTDCSTTTNSGATGSQSRLMPRAETDSSSPMTSMSALGATPSWTPWPICSPPIWISTRCGRCLTAAHLIARS